jgi:hypothetical protein
LRLFKLVGIMFERLRRSSIEQRELRVLRPRLYYGAVRQSLV